MKRLSALCLIGVLVGLAAAAPRPIKGIRTGFFDVYEANRASGTPNYVTEDFLALTYAMLVENAATEFERREALPALRELVPSLRARIGSETEPERLAQGFLAVFEALLLGAAAPLEAPDGEPAVRELALVREARGVVRSPLMRQTLDYSQFRVRGKYAASEELGRYFQAVRYAGTVLFPLLHSRSTGIGAEAADALTGAALAISAAVSGDEAALALYERATAPLGYLFGPPDALTVAEYAPLAPPERVRWEVGGAELPRLRLRLFARGVRPRVLGAAVDVTQLEPGVEPADALAGWQFLPSRLTLESAAFQELVYDRVGAYRGEGEPFTMGVINGRRVKAFPTVWELAALLGSVVAEERLRASGDTDYEGYAEARQRAAGALELQTGLAAEHFGLLRAWLRPSAQGPSAERRLHTALGFWALQRHGAVLYAKQSYTQTAKGLALAPPARVLAWIAPAELLYTELGRLAREVAERTGYEPLERYARLAERCAWLAARTPPGQSVSGPEAEFLNGLDAELLDLTGRKDRPVVVDYHTDASSGQAVEIALGVPRIAWAGPDSVEGGRGALFGVHQFKQPLAERHTDETWARLVAVSQAPGRLLATGAP